jgi:hypothetical protein
VRTELKPTPGRRETLGDVVRRQDGLLLRRQALRAGVTITAIRWRLARGRWQRVLPGLYATFTGALTEDQRLIAAALYSGEGAQITGAAALRWYGLRYGPPVRRIQVLVPSTTQRASRDFVAILRTTRLDPQSRLRPAMEVCSVARAAADAARCNQSLREIRAFIGEAVQRRLTTLPELVDELREGPKAGSALFRRVLTDLGAGVRSAPEAEFRDLMSRSKVLPKILWNPKLETLDGKVHLPTPDGWIQEVGLALEVDSREHHASPEGWERTMERHNLLAAHGILTLHFTPRDIRDKAAHVLDRVEHAYLERRGATAPRVRSVDVAQGM